MTLPTPQHDSPNVSDLIRGGELELVINGVPNARRNAEWMLSHVLGCRAADLYLDTSRQPGADEVNRYRELIGRRSSREPLQYIVGNTEFMSLPFETRPGVFIPRPDTECLAEIAEACLNAWTGPSRTVLDLCCGSGVIGVSLASRVSNVHLTAVDINPSAVALTLSNAARNGVATRTVAVQSEGIAFVRTSGVRFDMIVCNPPYIAASEMEALPPEVARHEPPESLDGGADGLDFYRALAEPAWRALVPGGWLLLEIGSQQARDVITILNGENPAASTRRAAASVSGFSTKSTSFVDIAVHRDYAGCDRVVVARRPI